MGAGDIPFDRDDQAAVAPETEGHPPDERRIVDSGELADSRQQLPLKRAAARFVVTARNEIDRGEHAGPRRKAGIDRLCIDQRADEQSRGHEQHERQCHLGDDERLPQARAPRCRRHRDGRLFQRRDEGCCRSLERRHQPENQRGSRRHCGREQQHDAVERRVDFDRQRDRRNEEARQILGAVRDEKAGKAAGCGDQRALGEQLLDETASTRAKRQANGGLALATGGAREHQVRDIRTRDQQDDARDRELHTHHRGNRDTAHAGRAPQLVQLDAVEHLFRVGRVQPLRDQPEVRFGPRRDGTRLHPDHHLEPVNTACAETIAAGDRRLHHHRHPQVEIQIRLRAVEPVRCDADDGERAAVERDAAPHHAWIYRRSAAARSCG